ncbi:glycoside hydrolase family 3 protein [Alteromonas facilis]|uniref:glycoside hydrolase family 3 protein n=1 Tax=Alteromonas facilis TaxID=2048004 RepID=UPI001F0CA1D0|nr:glycoside hydrolase family 3 N-terminal domain-containing protein [Alteromonas facilis]
MRLLTRLIQLALLLVISSCTYIKPTKPPEIICHWGTEAFDLCQYPTQSGRVEALINAMTLDEKLGQMTQSVWHNGVTEDTMREFFIGSIIHTDGPVPGDSPEAWMDKFDSFQRSAMSTRLGIPLLIGVDAVHGQNTFEGAVVFPHNIGLAATRNYSLIQEVARITALESVGTGFNWTFSPCIAMPEHEHWGRVYEGFSENLDITRAASQASIAGLQGQSLAFDQTIAATAKHYLGDGGTLGGVEGGNAIISDEALYQRHLPSYQQALEDNVAAVMVGFNSVNGTPMHQHGELVQGLLKQELGFEGVVLTDWNGGLRFGEPHTVINAGIDIAMQPGNHVEFITKLKASVLDGTVAMERINDAVRRILNMKFNLGLFSNPFSKRAYASAVGSPAHRDVARQAVRESLVLLKNQTQALPLDPQEALAVVGEHADNTGLQSGGWTIRWQGVTESYRGATSILSGIEDVAQNVEYLPQGCSADMHAEKVVVVVGERPYAEGEGDTHELWLSQAQKAQLANCKALGKQVITILISGRALIVNDELAHSDAFIAAWLPGSEGSGVADLLFSVDGFTPTGRLPHAWPKAIDDLPLPESSPKALFPIGYGLQAF